MKFLDPCAKVSMDVFLICSLFLHPNSSTKFRQASQQTGSTKRHDSFRDQECLFSFPESAHLHDQFFIVRYLCSSSYMIVLKHVSSLLIFYQVRLFMEI